MTYNILSIRTCEYSGVSMYPAIGDTPNAIELDGDDGDDIRTVNATGLQVSELQGGQVRPLVRFRDIKATVYVTDCRVAVGCSNYDKGGGWWGNSLAVPVLNMASKVGAAHRRKGKMLVGHVRYQWLSLVGHSSKTNWATNESLRLQLTETTGDAKRVLLFDLTLPKDIDGGIVAQTIARRAAAFRLNRGEELTPEARSGFTALLDADALEAEAKKYAFHIMPTYWNANSKTARVRVSV